MRTENGKSFNLQFWTLVISKRMMGYFGAWGQANYFIKTFLCRITTLVLEAQPYLFSFIYPIISLFYFFPFFLSIMVPPWLFFGTNYVDYQFWILKNSPIFSFSIQSFLGLFVGLRNYFWGWGSGSNNFLDLHAYTFDLKV